MILLLLVIGLLTLGMIFVPAFLVGLMKLTVIAVVAYVITISFMKREVAYLIVVLYVFAVLTSFVQYAEPHLNSIKDSVDKANKVEQKVDRFEQRYNWLFKY